MKKLLNKFSPVGLVFIGIHAILVLSIPFLAKEFPQGCGDWICIFSDEESYFFLFNLPGFIIAGYLISPILEIFRPMQARLNGELTLLDFIPMYVVSAFSYYFFGFFAQFVFLHLKQFIAGKLRRTKA